MRKILIVLAIVAGFMLMATPANATRPIVWQEYRAHPTIGASITQVRDCFYMRKGHTAPWYMRMLPRPTTTGKWYIVKAQRSWYKRNAVKRCSAWYTPQYSR